MRALLRRVVSGPPTRGGGHSYHVATEGPSSSVSPRELQRFYAIDPHRLPEALRAAYKPLSPDGETADFLASCRPSFLLSLAAKILRLFYSVTDTNGILNRGQMFVASTQQYRDLLTSALEEAVGSIERPANSPLTLLDVGAGDGDVTARLAPLFNGSNITVTEVSRPMARRLSARGYTTHVTPFLTEDLFPSEGVFDVVSIHNVLDRCDHPRDLLRGAIRLMRPQTGRLLLAVVLPFCELVEDGTVRRPVNGPLPMSGARCQDGASFEASLSALITRVLWPLGLHVERVAKLPYLCRGDMMRPYYVLADAILVCRLAGEGEGQASSALPVASVGELPRASTGGRGKSKLAVPGLGPDFVTLSGDGDAHVSSLSFDLDADGISETEALVQPHKDK